MLDVVVDELDGMAFDVEDDRSRSMVNPFVDGLD